MKAAFLLNFARLVEWPAEALPPEGQPLHLCTYGGDPFGDLLEQTFLGKKVQDRDVEIRDVETGEPLDACHMIFVATEDAEQRALVLDSTHSRSVLVVGQSDGYAAAGAAINLYEESGRIRFEVNRGAVKGAGLKASSRLLGLARIVGQEN